MFVRDDDAIGERVSSLRPRTYVLVRVLQMTTRYNVPIEVEVANGQAHHTPHAFSWRGRRYAVAGVLKYWREAGGGLGPPRGRGPARFPGWAEGGGFPPPLDPLAQPLAPPARASAAWALPPDPLPPPRRLPP